MQRTDTTRPSPAAAATGPGNTVERMEVVPSGKALGAEVRGIDLSKPLPAEVKDALLKTWYDHLVLVIRDQPVLSPAQYIEAARIFGTPVEGAKRRYIKAAGLPLDEEYPELAILSNLDANGNPVKENDGLGSMEVVWHSDNSYIENPPAGSCLYSLEVPPPEAGGNTSFSNQYLAYETLPDDLKRAIEGKRSKQDASRNSAGVLRPGLKEPTKPEEVPGPFHPLVRVHPGTGRKALYLGRRRKFPSQYIEGMPIEESEKVLDRLWKHATDPNLAWSHEWRVGDFLVWDNRSAQHRRDPFDEKYRRVMYRTQFQGEIPIPA
ncbi:MAG: TauD/TfdA family dioxygenase [Acetobacterales bacterium]